MFLFILHFEYIIVICPLCSHACVILMKYNLIKVKILHFINMCVRVCVCVCVYITLQFSTCRDKYHYTISVNSNYNTGVNVTLGLG